MFPSERTRAAQYERLARERREAAAAEERERLARIKYVARLGSGRPTVKASTFSELGDILSREGYKMHKAKTYIGGGEQLAVPHKDSGRPAAIIERRVE